jgi:hypothetical protein
MANDFFRLGVKQDHPGDIVGVICFSSEIAGNPWQEA